MDCKMPSDNTYSSYIDLLSLAATLVVGYMPHQIYAHLLWSSGESI